MTTTLLVVFTTLASREEARTMAKAMVEQKLVACAQITEIESIYAWQGAVHHEPEYRLTLKTTQARYPALEAAIKASHPYELPAIFAIAVAAAHPPYADWVQDSLA